MITNASNFIRGYDPQSGKELWRLVCSSKITAPTPIFANDLIVFASGRRPEQPIFVLRPGARGDITLADGQTKSDKVVWSQKRRGPYMPNPLIYDGILYVVANNGIFDAYEIERETGRLLSRTVPLKKGGFITIDHTEALVSIDVNSGRFRGGKGQEDTAFRTNMEAAKEVPRQLRLRDLGGIIVIDFIDMEMEENRKKILDELE